MSDIIYKYGNKKYRVVNVRFAEKGELYVTLPGHIEKWHASTPTINIYAIVEEITPLTTIGGFKYTCDPDYVLKKGDILIKTCNIKNPAASGSFMTACGLAGGKLRSAEGCEYCLIAPGQN